MECHVAEAPAASCIHDCLRKQVARTPDAVAVVFEDQQLTVSRSERQSESGRACLANAGVGPEVLVGICMERPVMVVGLLGQAGGAMSPWTRILATASR